MGGSYSHFDARRGSEIPDFCPLRGIARYWVRSLHITANFRIYRIRSILEFVVICPSGLQITSLLITYWGAIHKNLAYEDVWGL